MFILIMPLLEKESIRKNSNATLYIMFSICSYKIVKWIAISKCSSININISHKYMWEGSQDISVLSLGWTHIMQQYIFCQVKPHFLASASHSLYHSTKSWIFLKKNVLNAVQVFTSKCLNWYSKERRWINLADLSF